MNKLGIWAIAIAGAFVIGVLSANPVVEAVGGWQAAIELLVVDIGSNTNDIANLQQQIPPPTYWVFVSPSTGKASSLCDVGDKIIGGGTTVLGGAAEVRVSKPIFDAGTNSDQEGWRGEISPISGVQIQVSASCLDLVPLR